MGKNKKRRFPNRNLSIKEPDNRKHDKRLLKKNIDVFENQFSVWTIISLKGYDNFQQTIN